MSAVAELNVFETTPKEIRLDNRAANSMDSQTLEAHTQLEQHAKWAQENYSGWSSTTLMGRFEEQGDAIFSRTDGAPLSIPPDIALTDKALCKLGEVDLRVIKTYYNYWEPVEVIWRRARMKSKHEFQKVLRRARFRFRLHRASLEVAA